MGERKEGASDKFGSERASCARVGGREGREIIGAGSAGVRGEGEGGREGRAIIARSTYQQSASNSTACRVPYLLSRTEHWCWTSLRPGAMRRLHSPHTRWARGCRDCLIQSEQLRAMLCARPHPPLSNPASCRTVPAPWLCARTPPPSPPFQPG